MVVQTRIDPVALMIVVIAPLMVIAASRFAGPLKSGAFFLQWPGPAPSTAHDLGASYEPLHEGHFDLGTGLYIREDDDFVLHATPSFVFRRTYRTEDRRSREFGIGATHNADWYLVGDPSAFQWAALVFADGGRVQFNRVSKGTSYSNALFEHWTSSTRFAGSRLGWSGSEWLLRLYDGSLMRISPCGPVPGSKCTLLDMRDWDGHHVKFQRGLGMRLLRIDTGAQSIEFAYDDRQRVIEARDNGGHHLRYTYDEAGRLVRAVASDGIVRSYGYDAMDRMTHVEEPGRVIENTYDAEGLLTSQIVRFTDASGRLVASAPYVYEIAYKKEDGRIRQTDLRQSSGEHKRAVFDRTGYVVSETYAPDTPAAVSVIYDRDRLTNGVNAVTVTCRSGRWRSSHSASVEPGREQEVAAELFNRWCTPAQSATE
jgi:YD repeat-containing protein